MGENENRTPVGGDDDDLSPESVRAASEAIDNEDESSLRMCFNCLNMIWPRELSTFREIVGGGGKMYAGRNTKTGTISMHREILHAPPEMCVDHKNRNGLDNRRDNLRLCTPEQNTYNRGPRGRRSRFKGVYPEGDKWYATIKHKGVPYYLGTFDDETEAAKARDRKAYELEKDFAYLNFPDEIQREGEDDSTADTG